MSSRYLSEKEWIEKHGSGSLRHAMDLGCAYKDMYLHERIAFTFGASFDYVPHTRLMSGIPKAEPDCKPFTEGCWNIRRRISEKHPSDSYSLPQYLHITKENGIEEGLGIILLESGCDWIPKNYIVYTIVSPVKNNEYTGEVFCL